VLLGLKRELGFLSMRALLERVLGFLSTRVLLEREPRVWATAAEEVIPTIRKRSRSQRATRHFCARHRPEG